MLFLIRSAMCIGLVASALPDAPLPSLGGGDPQGLAGAALGELCRADPARCRAVAEAVLSPEPAADRAGRKLRDQPTRRQRLPPQAAVL